MKAEERHELRENDLANWLQFGLWAFLKQNGSYILLVLALAFLGYQLYNRYKQNQENAVYAAHMELLSAKNLADLENIISSSEFKPIKAQACLRLGKIYGEGVANPEMLKDLFKMSRNEALSKAYNYYTQALEFQGEDPLIAGMARIGIADVYEDRGEWDQAKAQYQQMIDDKQFAGSAHAALVNLAKKRMDTLNERREAPRLASMIPVKAPSTEPLFKVPGITPQPGNLFPGTGSVLPPSSSLFPGVMGPPSPSPSTTNPSSGLSPFGGTPLESTTTPATAPK